MGGGQKTEGRVGSFRWTGDVLGDRPPRGGAAGRTCVSLYLVLDWSDLLGKQIPTGWYLSHVALDLQCWPCVGPGSVDLDGSSHAPQSSLWEPLPHPVGTARLSPHLCTHNWLSCFCSHSCNQNSSVLQDWAWSWPAPNRFPPGRHPCSALGGTVYSSTLFPFT
jgi:hypothetical protein